MMIVQSGIAAPKRAGRFSNLGLPFRHQRVPALSGFAIPIGLNPRVLISARVDKKSAIAGAFAVITSPWTSEASQLEVNA